MVIDNTSTNIKEKYRIAFEPSDLYKDNTTGLAVEDIGIKLDSSQVNLIKNAEPSKFADIGFAKAKVVFTKGDVVTLIPLFDPPELNKKDESGNYLASWVIVRRVGGKL